ncbi:hypothetical protein AAC387_Pa10g0857 [Persea americana]
MESAWGTWAKSLTSDLAEGSVICIVGPNLSLSSSTTQTLKREQWKIFQAWDVPEYSIILLMHLRGINFCIGSIYQFIGELLIQSDNN